MLRVGVLGARGRMGSEVCKAVTAAEDMNLVAAIDAGDPVYTLANEGARIVVDFTTPDVVMEHLEWLIANNIHAVVGTTGFDEAKITQVQQWIAAQPSVGVLLAPNFSIGAILMMRFAEQAARFFDSAEIVELHHPLKVDAPSGTSKHTAQLIAAARREAGRGAMPDATKAEMLGARGADVEGVRIHSVRMTGLVAHQEVLFGDEGEAFSIRHDSFDRASFMPGVVAGIRGVAQHPGLTIGLEKFLGIA
jgi:4-hydroxy-tetrahydrodipicolinate reductase